MHADTRGCQPAQARKHVPYRESKLTRILQPSLAGNGLMAIVISISPAGSCADNTRSALHFASMAKRVVVAPRVNEVASSQAVIRRMQAEIAALRAQMVSRRPLCRIGCPRPPP